MGRKLGVAFSRNRRLPETQPMAEERSNERSMCADHWQILSSRKVRISAELPEQRNHNSGLSVGRVLVRSVAVLALESRLPECNGQV
jgi:hypothetical protein